MADTDQTVDSPTEQALPEPTIRLENAGPARKKLSIEIPQEAIAAKLDENFDSLQEEAAIPGFRRGHAPLRLLEKRFGSEVRKDVCTQLVGECYTQAVEKHNLRVLGEPEIKDAENLQLPESGPLSVDIEIEVVPEFNLPELKGFEVKKPMLQVTDEQVDREISRYGEMYGQFKPVDAAQAEDYITGDLVIRGGDGSVLQEMKGGQTLVPGERRSFKGAIAGILIDDLGKQLEGKKPGDTVTIQATGPERHENEAIAGKPITIELNVARVERLHPMSAGELVEAMGLESEAALKEQVREALQRRSELDQRAAMARQVLDALMTAVDLDLPEKLSARQAGSILQRRAMDLLQRGASRDDIEQNLAELRATSEALAQQELKRLFVLDAVARELNIEVSEAEVNGRIVQIATHQGQRPERVRDQMRQSGQLDQLFVQIREDKALAKLLEEAKVTEVSAEEWRGIEAGADAESAEASNAPA